MNHITQAEIRERIESALSHHFGTSPEEASVSQMYEAVVISMRNQLLEKRKESRAYLKEHKSKRLYYLCMEFLLGRSLKNNLYNLGEEEEYEKILKGWGFQLEQMYEMEPDAGLGNGGLGRLAACFLDALASQEYAAMGYTIRYEYGLFEQKIVDGWQVELPDRWLTGGLVWLTPRSDRIYEVRFGGEVHENWTPQGLRVVHTGYSAVEAMPYDMMISGNGNRAVSALRAWKPQNTTHFDMTEFSSGNYAQAMQSGVRADMIGKVLYPSDNTPEGKYLRLQQQYFLVSASAQDIVRRHLDEFGTLDNFAEVAAVHINDTHPAMVIPELMRIFMDDYGYSWEEAQHMVINSVSYTNHTVLAEALEIWPEDMLARLLPRIHQILQELNRRYCQHIFDKNPADWDKCERMAILSHGMVRMANLSVIGSHKVNGVSAMHSEILKKDVFRDFYEDTPDKFTNVTNGIAYRRWLCQSNPRLAGLIDDCIGGRYRRDGEELIRMLDFREDDSVLRRLGELKRENKADFSNYIKQKTGILLDPNSIYDVQVKRLHEYKRQLLNALHIISLYLQIKDHPSADVQPKTFLFGAKAAPGYDRAKQIIQLIVSLGEMIEKDPDVRGKIRVLFLENYSVTLAEHIMPAADISQQISLAGKEASGTGNMKLMINGALTLGTLDGANKEMHEILPEGSIYIFGMDENEVQALWQSGYDPYRFYHENEMLLRTIDFLKEPIAGTDFSDIYKYLLMGNVPDPYMCLADYTSYAQVHAQMVEDFADKRTWNQKSLENIAHAGYFVADKSIKTYANEIWGLKPLRNDMGNE